MAPTISISLTGRVAVLSDGQCPPNGELGPLTRVALAYLVLERRRPVTRDELAEALWGEELPSTWRSALRGVISRLRSFLAAAGVDGGRALTSVSGCYELRLPGEVVVDVEEAQRWIASARRAALSRDWAATAKLAGDAAGLCRAQFLPGAVGAWVERQQDGLDDILIQALELRSTAAKMLGDYATALDDAELAVSLRPLRESAHQCVIEAHATAGNRAEALRAYERCRRTLVDHLGVGPSPRMEATYVRLLGEGSEVTPSGKPRPFLSNLAAPATTFVGRAADVEEVRQALALGKIVTLVGTGGVGKSRLAAEVAGRAAGAYPGGVWLVELAGVSDPQLIGLECLSAVGVPERLGEPAASTLARHFGTQSTLLLLDGCERIAAACGVFAEALLPSSPRLAVLATSREPLGVDLEHIVPVRPLALPDPEADLPIDELMAFDAVRLFVDRARAAAGGLDPAAVTRDISTICHRLDGLPLAIELAAAHVRTLTIPDIAERLSDRFSLPARPACAAHARHATMRDALEWSYDILSDAGRGLFAELSVFVGGFTLRAVEAVCTADEADLLPTLSRLVDHSLVEPVRTSNRYRMLGTLQQFAAGRLTAEGRERRLRDRHLEWIRRFARSAEEGLEGAQQAHWLDAVEAEHDNVRAALDWAAYSSPAAGVEVAAAIWRFYEVRGHLSEGRARLDEAMRSATDLAPALRAKALNAAGILAQRSRDLPAARAHHAASLAIRTEIGDHRGMAAALLGLGNVAVGAGDLAAAQTSYQENVRLARQLADPSMTAASLMNLGVVTQLLLDAGAMETAAGCRTARQAYEESLGIYRDLGDRHNIALALENLGVLASFEGDRERARSFLEQSLAMRRQLGDRIGIAAAARFLGQLAFRRGDLREARDRFEESLAIERGLANRALTAADLVALGDIAAAEGRPSEAQARFDESLALYAELGDARGIQRVRSKLRQGGMAP